MLTAVMATIIKLSLYGCSVIAVNSGGKLINGKHVIRHPAPKVYIHTNMLTLIPHHFSMEAQLEEMWYCHMNTDLSYQSCDLAEEEWQFPDSGWIYTYQGLVLGQLVWAKMNGYPP